MSSTTARDRWLVVSLLTLWLLVPEVGAAKVYSEPQQSTNWCWAASAQMVMDHLRPSSDDWSQVNQAQRLFPSCACDKSSCQNGYSNRCCDRGGFPQFEKFEVVAEKTRPYDGLGWPHLLCELRASRPVVFAWESLDRGAATGSGHMMVATSAERAHGERWIAILDPAPICRGSLAVITYREFLGSPTRAHWIDYYGLRTDPADDAWRECAKATDSAEPEEPAEQDAASVACATSPDRLLEGIQQLLDQNPWFRRAVGIVHDGGTVTCTGEMGTPIESLSIRALRQATDDSKLILLTEATGRRRYECRVTYSQEQTVPVSIVLSKQPDGFWHVARIGDLELARRLSSLRTELLHGGAVREIFVQGLNAWLLWSPNESQGESRGVVIPVFHLPGAEPEEALRARSEQEMMLDLRKLARSFHAVGPS